MMADVEAVSSAWGTVWLRVGGIVEHNRWRVMEGRHQPYVTLALSGFPWLIKHL